VGGLLQAVKLFACSGVVGTQVLVGIYVASFVVVEAFRLAAGRPHAVRLVRSLAVVRLEQRLTRVRSSVLWIAGAAQLGVLMWIVYATLPSYIERSEWLWLLLLCLPCGSIFLLLPMQGPTRYLGLEDWAAQHIHHALGPDRGHWTGESVAALLFVVFWLIVSTYVILWACTNSDLHFAGGFRITPSVRVGWAISLFCNFFWISDGVFLLLSSYSSRRITRVIRKVLGLPEHNRDYEGLSVFCLVSNLAYLMVYYSRVYDASGTYKPQWTDAFG